VKLLVVGGGGREHALAWALHRDDPSNDIFCAPGNPGTAQLATNLPIPADDLDGLVRTADQYGIDLTIIGPEAPLAAGLADRLTASGHPVFGPTEAGARIEASKAFAKDIMNRAGIATAHSRTFHDTDEALAYVAAHAEPLVVKASGLAAGKGAVVCATRTEAEDTVRAMMVDDRFGAAGRVVVVEDFLEGEECSILAFTDGNDCELLPISQDHKRLGEGDVGPNTGGMGAYSPVSLITDDLLDRIHRDILQPTLHALAQEGAPYTGVLYAGLMIDHTGTPSVVEFNCRLGDPEAQVVLPLVAQGLLDCLQSIANGGPPTSLATTDGASVTTVLAAKGYPDAPEKGAAITIPDVLPPGVTVFHAGTRQDQDGVLRVNGGRVLTVTAVADTFSEAQRLSRDAAESIEFEGKVFRRDIGWREAERREASRRGSGAAGLQGQ
jgi:phosphoribosylamine--glycine ligase